MTVPRALVMLLVCFALACDATPDGPSDAASSDALVTTDAASPDAGDAGAVDSGATDSGAADSGAADASVASDAGLVLLPTVQFSTTYKWDLNGTCSSPEDHPVIGYAPATTGVAYPLFIYAVGTFDTFNNPIVLSILQQAASRGFVTASINYDNGAVLSCDHALAKARCIYSDTEADTAVATLCARADVDCSLGIVAAGHSQGSGMAILANEFNTGVRGALALGATCDYFFDFGAGDNPGLCSTANPMAACLLNANLSLPTSSLRIFNGENESFGHQNEYERITGVTCPPGTFDCMAGGSGWYIVSDAEVEDGDADHGFFVNGMSLDAGFGYPASNIWSLGPNVDWLRSLTDATN